jgi:lysophospholipid acyltransferase (LPLAT)-like uncharacterized protein
MPINTKAILTSEAFLSFLYRFIRIYSSTFHYTITNEKEWMDYLKGGGNVLICAWHQQFFAAIHYFKTYEAYHPPLMISKSMDGAIIAGVARRSGWNPILGSSSRGGAEALKGMINGFKQAHLAGHVVDGPRGPAGKIKAGIIRLAHAADAAIVPFYTLSDRSWYFNSWDNFLLPKPFARINLAYDAMIKFNPTVDPDEFEAQRQQLEQVMTPGLQGRLATKDTL